MEGPFLSILLLASVTAYAQNSPFAVAAQPPQGAYRIGGGVSAPRVISGNRTEPDYAEEARIARLQGTVLISLVVGEDGAPRNVRAIKSLGFGLDEQAIEAISTWRFAPGQKEGNPVPVLTTIEVNFVLPGPKGYWHLAQATFNPPEGASIPSLVKPEFPPDDPAREPASVAVTFDVDEHGNPINLHVEKSSDPRSEDDVITAVREWRFKPGIRNGMPVVVPLTLEFYRSGSSPPPAKIP
jgi:TonB family protein